jgi:hypothetical protein
MEKLINYIEKIYAFFTEKKSEDKIYKDENLLISHTVCNKGNTFKYKCDICESLSGRCIN